MMRSTIFFVMLLLMACQKPPCGYSKQDLLNSMSDLREQIKDKDNLSKNQMKEMDGRVEKLVEECYQNYEDDLTRKENRAFWSDVSGYYFSRHGLAALSRIDADLDDMGKALGENIEAWVDESSEKIEQWMERFKDEDLEDLKIQFEGDFDDMAKQLEEWVKENFPEDKE